MLPCSVCRNHDVHTSWKLWQPGGCTYGCGVFGVTPDRNVTSQMMTTANAGSSVGAGVVSGALAWLPRRQIQQSGSVVQIEGLQQCKRVFRFEGNDMLRSQRAWQGSQEPFGHLGGSKCRPTTKGLTDSKSRTSLKLACRFVREIDSRP